MKFGSQTPVFISALQNTAYTKCTDYSVDSERNDKSLNSKNNSGWTSVYTCGCYAMQIKDNETLI